MMMDFFEFATSGFWVFIGCWILVWIPFEFAFKCWNRWLRSRNIKARGWPPEHLDADGDFAQVEEDE